MGAEPRKLHVAFLPLMAPGHTIPLLDIVRLFTSRHHVKATIFTTPLNAPNIENYLHKLNIIDDIVDIEIFPFPSHRKQPSSQPEGVENIDKITSPEMPSKFMKAIDLLQQPIEEIMERTRPNCLVADMFFSFATDLAAKFGIPRLVFHGSSFFSMCVMHVMKGYEPFISVSSDDEPFVLPNLPHEITFTKSQMVKDESEEKEFSKMMEAAHKAELKSYGVVFNSLYELEGEYVDYYRKVLGRRAWHIGPVSLCNKLNDEKSQRGEEASIDEHECLKWLDSKEPDLIIYVCFGSLAMLPPSTLKEIAMALEGSGINFIWVVKRSSKEEEEEDEKSAEEWLPPGFEERVEGRGLIIRGWAPQVLILDHKAVGGFVTHCGWNSILEGISAGVPMVTWPVFAEQFCNEKLVTDVLKVGVQVGSKQWNSTLIVEGTILKAHEIEGALKRVMMGEESLAMRSRAKKLKEMARKAMEEGGLSFCDLSALIQELSSYDPLH